MDAIKSSVTEFLEAQPDVLQVEEVIVICFNADGDLGAIANRTMPVARLQRVSGFAL